MSNDRMGKMPFILNIQGPHSALLHLALVNLHSAMVDEWPADDLMAGRIEN